MLQVANIYTYAYTRYVRQIKFLLLEQSLDMAISALLNRMSVDYLEIIFIFFTVNVPPFSCHSYGYIKIPVHCIILYVIVTHHEESYSNRVDGFSI